MTGWMSLANYCHLPGARPHLEKENHAIRQIGIEIYQALPPFGFGSNPKVHRVGFGWPVCTLERNLPPATAVNESVTWYQH
jgi:hypothetical protein